MAQCVFCEKIENLNTQLTISLDDGKKVTVNICDIHAEDATIKTARVAYLDKQSKINVLIEQAKALGLNITGLTQQGSLLIPTIEKPAQVQQQAPQQFTPTLDGDVVSTKILDSRRGMQSVGGVAGSERVDSHSSHSFSNLESKLPPEVLNGKAKIVMTEARAGSQIAIPEIRVDGTGTTRLRILKIDTDAKLQARFKNMADRSIRHDDTPNFARDGYQRTQVECPLCRGSGNIKQSVGGVLKETKCPKCGGIGFISII